MNIFNIFLFLNICLFANVLHSNDKKLKVIIHIQMFTHNNVKLLDFKEELIPKKESSNPLYGNTLTEKEMIELIYKFHSGGIPLRKIVELINKLGYKTRKNTPLQLTQIARIIKQKHT